MKSIFSFLILFFCLNLNAQTGIKNVDAANFKKYIDENKSVLIDLRTTDEMKTKGMIKGALQIDFLAEGAEASILKLDKKKTYLIYCASGRRSGECADLMQKSGFKQVINLEKGFSDWKNNGFPIEKN